MASPEPDSQAQDHAHRHGHDREHEHEHEHERQHQHQHQHEGQHQHQHEGQYQHADSRSHAHAHSGHDHHHGHGHSHHGHVHAPKDFGAAFAIGVLLNGGFVVAEVVYGLRSGSLALLADAGHNLGDVLALLLAWGAAVLVRRAPTRRFTYGLRGTSILAALANACVLMLVTGAIAWEAVVRLRHPAPVVGATVVIVAALGVAINLGTALMFMRGREHDLNIRAAFLHMASDAAVSLGVVVAGLLIMRTGWGWLDPAVSLAISAAVIVATWGVLRDSVRLALQAVPEAIDPGEVHLYLSSIDGVARVHDLHIWGMSTTENALTARLVFPQGYPGDVTLKSICAELRERHGIAHTTLQVETVDSGESGCVLVSP